MPDREKVVKGLECCMSGQPEGLGCDRVPCPYNDIEDCEGALHYDVIVLLKAQEPVEPTEPDEDITRYCGACGSPVGYEVLETPGIEYVQYNYCPECGRPVKWE